MAPEAADAPERAGGEAFEPAELKRRLRDTIASCETSLEGIEPGLIVHTPSGSMRVDDFIATRCIDGVVHGLDLAAAVPATALTPDAEALRITVRALLGALTTKAPGKSVEVRVPPVAAVQCLEGPRHTRGTPPNVVETDPITWVELASGRLAWTDAVADGRLRASGERSDIQALLPLV